MKAIEITEFGAPEVLKLGERPTPAPGKCEVLIFVDLLAAHEQQVVLGECFAQSVSILSGDGTSQVEIEELGAKRLAQTSNPHVM